MVATVGGAGQGRGGNTNGPAIVSNVSNNPPAKIYLDSYLETLTSLPAEVHRLLQTLRDIDERMQDLQLDIQEKLDRCLQISPQSSRNTSEQQKKNATELRKDIDYLHDTVRMLSSEKVALARQALTILNCNIEYLDEELIKFEEEITLNTAQAELDQIQQAQAMAQRDRAATTYNAAVITQEITEEDIEQGDQVAARISVPGAPDEWILARVMNISSDQSTYTILDEDAEDASTSSIHHLPHKQIISLPKVKEKRNALLFSDGNAVLAVFPNTTVFYRAVVVQAARWQGKNGQWGNYLLAFDDDEDPNHPGYQAQREVAFQYVIPFPSDFQAQKF